MAECLERKVTRKEKGQGILLDEYGAISRKVRDTKSGPLGERETIGQAEHGMRFASNVFGVRTAGSREENAVAHLLN